MKLLTYISIFTLMLGMRVVHSNEERGAASTLKQSIFLLCPHKSNYGAYSLYFEVDRKDPSKIIRMGLEELVSINSKDSSYKLVLVAEKKSATERKKITTLEATEFGKKELIVKEDEALNIALEPRVDGSFHLQLSMRVGISERFEIGRKNKKKNDIIVRYNASTKTWNTVALSLTGSKGEKLVRADPFPISGLLFPVTGSGIYTILAVVHGSKSVTLMERSSRQ